MHFAFSRVEKGFFFFFFFFFLSLWGRQHFADDAQSLYRDKVEWGNFAPKTKNAPKIKFATISMF